MFGSGTGSRSKRRSFFLFGSDSNTSTNPSSTSTTEKTRTRSSQKPLSKKPLNEKAISSTTKHRSVSASSTTRRENKVDKKINDGMKDETIAMTPVAESAPSFHAPTEVDRTLSKPNTNRTRRPPPPLDIDSLKKTLEKGSTPPSVLPISQDIEPLTINEINKKGDGPQHRRQRSDAEVLVDDIENYIQEHKAKSPPILESPNESPIKPLIQDTRLNSDDDIISAESSLLFMSPLDVGSEPMIISGITDDNKGNKNSHNNEVNNNFSVISQSKDSIKAGTIKYDTDIDETESTEDEFSFSKSDEVEGDIEKEVSEIGHQFSLPVTRDESIERLVEPARKNTNPFYNNIDTNKTTSSTVSASDLQNNIDKLTIVEEAPCLHIPEVLNVDKHYETESGKYDDNVEVHINEDDAFDLEPRRTFRIANEDHPTFFLNEEAENEEDDEENHNQTFECKKEVEKTLETSEMSDGSISNHAKENLLSQDSSYYDIPAYDSSALGAMNTSKDDINNDLDSAISSYVDSVPYDRKGNRSLVSLTTRETNETPAAETTTLSNVKSNSTSVTSPKREKPVRLVSSYVEELRLKYYKTSNFLQAPPNLPLSLKQKNNVIQPKNVKVRIRTSSKQIGIKHGRMKQKLLSLETTNEEPKNDTIPGLTFGNTSIDHTKEFHRLLNKENNPHGLENISDHSDDFLNDIPGDEAYNSDDAMAPLREKRDHGQKKAKEINRSDTVVSYFTRSQNRFRSGTLEAGYVNKQKLPQNISIDDYIQGEENRDKISSVQSTDSIGSTHNSLLENHLSNGGLHIANPDSDSD